MFYYLSLSSALFAVGLFGILSHSSVRGQIVSLFILFNACVIALAAFEEFIKSDGQIGQIFLVIAIIITALYFFLAALMLRKLFHRNQTSPDDEINLLN